MFFMYIIILAGVQSTPLLDSLKPSVVNVDTGHNQGLGQRDVHPKICFFRNPSCFFIISPNVVLSGKSYKDRAGLNDSFKLGSTRHLLVQKPCKSVG